MVSEYAHRFMIWIGLKKDELMAEAADVRQHIDALATDWQRIKLKIMSEGRNILMAIGGLIITAQGVMQAMGVSLGAVGDLVLQMVSTIVTSVTGMVLTYSSMGPVGLPFIAIAIVALEFAIANQIRSYNDVQAGKEQIQGIQRALGGLQTTLRPWS
jgi:uncharacterized membrane protein